MDYYSNSRGGRSSYRSSSSSFRGSRGAPRGSRGFASRGSRGGSSSASYKPYDAPPSSRYSSSGYEGSKYGSSSSSSSAYPSSHRSGDDYFSRRQPETFGTREREHRSDLNDLASRKRERSDSYSQGVSRRGPHDDEYRGSAGGGGGGGGGGRYSGGSESSAPSRSYDDSRAFKKPRSEFKPDYKSEHRVRERAMGQRGSFAPRRPGFASYRGRGSFLRTSSTSGRANTSEILAIRRAKLLQKRIKEQTAANGTDVKVKTDIKLEDGNDGNAVDTEAVTDAPVISERGKIMMKLDCPACLMKCITFREYATHLHQPIHLKAMDEKVSQLRTKLSSMRLKQREAQKQIDANDLESLSLEASPHFCAICKLNYSQDVDKHESSDMHKQLRDILLPECEVCRIPFRNLVQYENHLCSLSHLKQKNIKEDREKRSLPSSGILDKFITLDSVGSGDEVDEKEGGDKDEDGGAKEKDGATAGGAAEGEADDLILGAEFIHEVPAQFCEVCRKFLRPRRDKMLTIKNHCCTKEHLRAYLHYGSDELLEKIKKADNKDKSAESEEALDEGKLWDGLSEILDDGGQPSRNDDDDEEEEGGRFDRINSKEKNENGDALGGLEAADDADPDGDGDGDAVSGDAASLPVSTDSAAT